MKMGALNIKDITKLFDEVKRTGENKTIYTVLGPPDFDLPYDIYQRVVTPQSYLSTSYACHAMMNGTLMRDGKITATTFRPKCCFDNLWAVHKFRCQVGYAKTRADPTA